MSKSRFIVAAFFLVAACKGGETVEPLVTTTVLVTAAPTSIAVNETAQASAIVNDQKGQPLTGKTIVWTSLNQNVATVTSAGVIRGVAPGTATIQGAVDGKMGTATVLVVAPVQSCVGGPTAVDLAVGQARVLSASDTKGCIKISATSAASQYVVIAASTNSTPDDLATFALKSDEGETVPNTTFLANPFRISAQLGAVASDAGSLQVAFETKLRKSERRELEIPAAQHAYSRGVAERQQRASMSVAAIPTVGEKTSFKVPTSCKVFTTVTATVRHISNRSIIYTDDASPAGGFADSDYQAIGTEFDNLIYPTDTDYFGTPLDLDANSRVIILYTPEVNKLTPAGNPGGFVGGFFFAGDLFPATGAGSCAQSNVAELFYVLSPDPGGTINGNVRTTESVRQGTRGTIAHEFQHMINASERIRSPIEQDFEDTWLDEGLAHFAEDLNGRVLKGLNETGNYSSQTLLTNVNDYSAFFFQNFARFSRYLQNPGPNSGTSKFSDSSLADRGAAWALVRYSADHYAPNGNTKAFTRALAGGPNIGVNNLVTRAGGVPFDTLIAGWMIANYADDAGIPNLPVKYTYKTYDMRNNIARVNNNAYALAITDITTSSFAAPGVQVRSASGVYFRFTRGAGAAARSFRMLNNDLTTAASFTKAALIVLRSQ